MRSDIKLEAFVAQYASVCVLLVCTKHLENLELTRRGLALGVLLTTLTLMSGRFDGARFNPLIALHKAARKQITWHATARIVAVQLAAVATVCMI